MADTQSQNIVGKVIVGSLIAIGIVALVLDLMSGGDSVGQTEVKIKIKSSSETTNYSAADDCIFPPEMDIQLPNNQVRWADINVQSARNLAYPGWEQPEVWGILKPEQQGFQQNYNIL